MAAGQPALAAYLGELTELIDAALARIVADLRAPAIVIDVMRYPLLGGGKRLRPCLTLATADATGAALGRSRDAGRRLALPAACAVEMIHTYSLVHDDLPAMDNDALRRGRPTTHVVYGDGLAVLAGDGLLTEAFAVVSAAAPGGDDEPVLSPSARLEIVQRLSAAAGAAGMVGGQAIDLSAADNPALLDADALADMHARKTGALIRAAACVGAVAVGAPERHVRAVDAYARDLGLAFQIIDDVLDVEGSSASLGKTAGKDEAAGKPTFPARYGIAGSRRLAEEAIGRAHRALDEAGLGGLLTDLATWSLTRTA